MLHMHDTQCSDVSTVLKLADANRPIGLQCWNSSERLAHGLLKRLHAYAQKLRAQTD